MLRTVPLALLALVSIARVYPQDTRSTTPIDGRGAGAILTPGEQWVLLGQGYQLTADSAVDNSGNVYFTDSYRNRIMKVDPAGRITTWKENSNGAHGIAFGPDGRLYAGQHDRKRVVAFSPGGEESVLAEGVQSHHLTVTARNDIYLSQPPAHMVWLVKPDGRKRVVHEGMEWPRGVRASNTQPLLAIADSRTPWVWLFQIGGDGSLLNPKQFCGLEAGDATSGIDSGGMTFDSQGYLYVATQQGVQVCDPQGRVSAILRPPGTGGLTNVFFGGTGFQWLYVTEVDRIYRRPARRRGVPLPTAPGGQPPGR
ncbi:SMP-30/gluconolactonase/LRE family protein [Paludibaculum fermentans]|uniref:SMP-30/gluconolactonase/LRE family protein n=1 Tax=Paludibaculum fermentans TaxID=1473598 RepID=A0A7S7SM55_PALFE|nr:SMP-30/gluconolactonase/LRE family protein [Paludibaculum fermentans]QOY90907.1 SMP-30/gluconolactonase/LRE family protein [Paludibaculum fermentans]